MLKKIVPALLVAGAAITSASAADNAAAGPYVGFEFGFNFNLYNDDRLEGASTSFALAFPIGSKMSVSVYHERGNFSVEEDGGQDDYDTTANEIRVRYSVWGNDTQDVSLFLGFGNLSIDDGTEDCLLGDLGAQYVPVSAKTGPIKGQLDIHANYRYARIEDGSIGSPGGGDDITDLGGFQIGLGVGIYF